MALFVIEFRGSMPAMLSAEWPATLPALEPGRDNGAMLAVLDIRERRDMSGFIQMSFQCCSFGAKIISLRRFPA